MTSVHAYNFTAKKPQQLEIINIGTNALATRIEMIRSAKKSIDAEYFIFRDDNSGSILIQEMIKKARTGVKVRILLDYLIGKKTIGVFHAHELRKLGIEIKYFNTLPKIRFNKMQYRNHRKFLIIDGKDVLTGGRNIGDEYFDMSEEYNFLDRDIRLKGSLAPKIQETFNAFWNSKRSKVVERPDRPVEDPFNYDDDNNFDLEWDQERWDAKEKEAKDFVFPSPSKNQELNDLSFKINEFYQTNVNGKFTEDKIVCKNTQFVSDYPKLKRKAVGIVKNEILSRIAKAKKDITIDSPYFIMERKLDKKVEAALERGVELYVFTNGLHSTDAIYVSTVLYSGVKKWIRKGAKIYIFKGFHPDNYPLLLKSRHQARWGTHAKSFIFDYKDSLVTSFNFDPRSSNYNMEAGIFCNNDTETAALLQSDITFKMQNGRQLKTTDDIKKHGFKNTSFWKRMSFYLIMLPSQLFQYLL